MTLADLTPGEYFGELAAIDGAPRLASVLAVEATVVMAMSPEQFVRLISEHPTLAPLMSCAASPPSCATPRTGSWSCRLWEPTTAFMPSCSAPGPGRRQE